MRVLVLANQTVREINEMRCWGAVEHRALNARQSSRLMIPRPPATDRQGRSEAPGARCPQAGHSAHDLGRVSHQCHTRSVPTRRRRHAITETPPVQAALDELREALGDDRVELGELVILGAHEKLARVRAEHDGAVTMRRRLAERVRQRQIPVDPTAADEARRSGWARP
jgi:hypothetical protein